MGQSGGVAAELSYSLSSSRRDATGLYLSRHVIDIANSQYMYSHLLQTIPISLLNENSMHRGEENVTVQMLRSPALVSY
jgi:hypothetical protein